jgi:hypothetical protein
MNSQKDRTRHLWYGIAILSLLAGWLAAGSLFLNTLRAYPGSIVEAYKDPRHKVDVPGSADLQLSRKGAYGVYYEGNEGAYVHAEWPPRLDCRLTAKATGADVPLVADYVPGNRYSTKEGKVGVLIYSTTVQKPGLYTLACDDTVAARGTRHHLAIGPNYVFEFMRVAWHLGGSLLGALAICGGSTLLSMAIVVITFLRTRQKRRIDADIVG